MAARFANATFPTATGSDLFVQVRDAVNAVIDHYKELVKDGLTFAEIWALVSKTTATVVALVEEAGPTLSGADKKVVVMTALAEFYDEVIAPIDIPYVPHFIETRVVDPKLRTVFLGAVEGTVDALVAVLNRAGWKDSAPGPMGVLTVRPY